MEYLIYVLIAVALIGVAWWAMFYSSLAIARTVQWIVRHTRLRSADWNALLRAVFGNQRRTS